MGTRALIAKEYEKDKYVVAEVDFDGYPTHLGAVLLDYYGDEKMVNNIISWRWFKTLEKPRSKDVYTEDLVLDKCDKIEKNSLFTYMYDYVYIFTLDKKWVIRRSCFDHTFYDLKDEVNKDFKNTPFYDKRPFGLYGFFDKNGKKLPTEVERLEEFKKSCDKEGTSYISWDDLV